MSAGKPLDGLEAEIASEAHTEARSAEITLDTRAKIHVPGWMNHNLSREAYRERRDLTVGTATAAGHLVATDLKGLIPILEPKLTIRELGATMFSDLQGNVDFPRQTTDAVAAWAATEAASAAETDPTVDKVSLSPKRLTATTDLTERLMIQSSISVENWIRQRLNFAVKKALDLAAINGSGASGQPLGILNRAVNDIVLGANGAALTWANVVDFETQIAIDDAEFRNIAYLTNPNVFGKLKTTEKVATTGMFIANGAIGNNSQINEYQAMLSTIMPNNLSKGASSGILSAMIFGNWAELYLGQWGGISLIVDPYSKSRESLVAITIHSYWDIALAHENSFCKCDEIITT